jgi:hypothetical protein
LAGKTLRESAQKRFGGPFRANLQERIPDFPSKMQLGCTVDGNPKMTTYLSNILEYF